MPPTRLYSRELADAVLSRMAEGESLRSICRDADMPSRPTVYGWMLDDVEGFAAQYARAREMQAHALADDLMAISDDGSNDWMERNDPENPGWIANGEHIQRSRLRVDSRKWAASKIMPKVYGEKQSIDHTVSAAPASRTSDADLIAIAIRGGIARGASQAGSDEPGNVVP